MCIRDSPMAQDPIGALLVEKLEEPEHARYYDKDLIERAFFLARKAHAGQKRRSGEDYLVHPCLLYTSIRQTPTG